MGQAFDQAWAEIARDFGDIPSEIDDAWLRLADAMFSVAIEGTVEVAALKDALAAMEAKIGEFLKTAAQPAPDAKRQGK